MNLDRHFYNVEAGHIRMDGSIESILHGLNHGCAPCTCRYLQRLSLVDQPRLKDSYLEHLVGLHSCLQHLDLRDCAHLTPKALPHLQALTALQSLVLTSM